MTTISEAFEKASAARVRWLDASDSATNLGKSLFQPGSGYGDPEAKQQDEHKLQLARLESERLFREYNDLDRKVFEAQTLAIQRSQKKATWAAFSVAAAVGIKPLVELIKEMLKFLGV